MAFSFSGESDKRKMSATQEEDKKPGEQGGVHINLKVKGQVASIVLVCFRSRVLGFSRIFIGICLKESFL